MMAEEKSPSRPVPLRTLTTPPTSPLPKPPSPTRAGYPSSSLTPPPTPTRSDSVTSMRMVRKPCKPATSAKQIGPLRLSPDGLLEYNTNKTDYIIITDKRLGSGRFSQVYLAHSTQSQCSRARAGLTPLASPTCVVHKDAQSASRAMVFAVKVATDKASLKALRNEARILSHLCSDRSCDEFIVPFHGFDARRNSLVFTALPRTLAELIAAELEFLHEQVRVSTLSRILPHIARSLITGLAWMHSMGVVHADVKPPNILLRPDIPTSMPLPHGESILDMPFTPVFADFTSSFLVIDDPKNITSAGGGTYDYMAPEQLSAPFPLPDFKMDVYALAVTLLELVTGRSPFRDAGTNRHTKMAMIKEGHALAWAMRDSIGEKRLGSVAQTYVSQSRLDLEDLLQLGLNKSPADRLTAEQWAMLW